MTTPIHDTDPADPAASLAAIDAAQQRTARAIRPSPLGMFVPWGVGYLVGFGGVWLQTRGLLPTAVVAPLLVLAAVVPLVSTTVTVGRSSRGLSGASRRVGAMYGWAWFLGFVALSLVNLRVGSLGVPGPTMSLVWSGSALVLVGVMYLAGGALWNHLPQYVLGVWTLACAVACVLVGYPANFAVLALAGGGGFVALGVWMHLRERR